MKIKFIYAFLLLIYSFSFAVADDSYIIELLQKGELEQAMIELDKSTIEPANYAMYKGIIYHAQYNADSALVYLEKAYRSNVRTDDVLIKLAQAMLWKKNFKNSKPILAEVQDKTSVDYLKTVANRYEVLGDFKQAVKLYDAVIPLEELPYGTMEKKAILLSWMKKFDESIELLDYIINTKIVSEPLRIRALIHKATVISWKKDFNTPMTILDDVLVRDPKNAQARFVKAEIFEWHGKYKDAKDIYKDVLLIDPENVEAKWKLEKLLWVK